MQSPAALRCSSPRRARRLGGVRRGAVRRRAPGPAERQARRDPAEADREHRRDRGRRAASSRRSRRSARSSRLAVQTLGDQLARRRTISWRRPRPTPTGSRWTSCLDVGPRSQKTEKQARGGEGGRRGAARSRCTSGARQQRHARPGGQRRRFAATSSKARHYLHHVSSKRSRSRNASTALRDELDDAAGASSSQRSRPPTQAARRREPSSDRSRSLRAAADGARERGGGRAELRREGRRPRARSRQQLEAQLAGDLRRDRGLDRGPPAARRRSGSGRFIRPVAGGRSPAASATASTRSPGQQALHAGVDFGAACGTPIHAAGAGDGRDRRRPNGGYGNATVIDHGGGIATLYGHQSRIAVSRRPARRRPAR